MKCRWFIFFVVALTVIGCKQSAPVTAATTTNAPPATNALPYLPYAQTNLTVIKLYVGAHELQAECALSLQQMATGMMWRTNLDENAAMLFAFGRPHRASFYMRNTQVPLSAAYLDPDGVIREIHELKPLDETGSEADSDQIQYVLEANRGWFARHSVSTGAVVRSQFGALSKTFTFQP